MGRLVSSLPQPVVALVKTAVYLLSLIPNAIYDTSRYLRYSALPSLLIDSDRWRGMIMKDAHRLEKGLAMPAPRPGFGRPAAGRLLTYLEQGTPRWGWDDSSITASNVLVAYVKFQRTVGIHLPDIEHRVEALRDGIPPQLSTDARGGTVKVLRSEVLERSKGDLADLLSVRHSIRQFDAEVGVSRDVIESAIRLAQHTPSVCNRQPWRVHVYGDRAAKDRVLELQNGNRGFGDRITYVLAITTDLRYFEGPGERNQAYVDGGLFAMTLSLALHHLGAATCFLNWSAPANRDLRQHKRADIPRNEVIITLMGVGGMPAAFEVAESPRRNDDLAVWH